MSMNGKIAILINGLYRPNVKQPIKKLLDDLKNKFPNGDMYFHTWEDKKSMIPDHLQDRLYVCPEPIMTYHPISDTTGHKHGKFRHYKEKGLLHNKFAHASKQILGYANLYQQVEQGYDHFIRLRWDTQLDIRFDFRPYLDAIDDGPIGFMTRGGRGHKLGSGETWPVSKENKSDDWYGYLPDVMIMHHRRHFDPYLVEELHTKKKLTCAEWGWYQVMSQPYGDIHQSIHGGAGISR